MADKVEKSEEELAQETAKLNEKTKKDFETKIDSSEDFSEESLKTKNQKFAAKVKKYGAVSQSFYSFKDHTSNSLFCLDY